MGYSNELLYSVTKCYEMGETIGKGCFSKVKVATVKNSSKKVAIKIIKKNYEDDACLKGWYRQVHIMKKIDHPYIVRLIESFEKSETMFLIMEYAENGSLEDYFSKVCIRFTQEESKRKFRQIALAIDYLHSNGIVHRDLKISNLVMTKDDVLKVADFGFAVEFRIGQRLRTSCGTPLYAPPEIFEGLLYDGFKVDIWSLGVILYRFVTGKLPFHGTDFTELREKVLSTNPNIPPYVHLKCRDLINEMLSKSPDFRPSMKEILRNRWFDTVKNLDPQLSNRNVIESKSNYPGFNKFMNDGSTIQMSELLNSTHMRYKTKSGIPLKEFKMYNPIKMCNFHLPCTKRFLFSCIPIDVASENIFYRFLLRHFHYEMRKSSMPHYSIQIKKDAFESKEALLNHMESVCNKYGAEFKKVSKRSLLCWINQDRSEFFSQSFWEMIITCYPPKNCFYEICLYHTSGHVSDIEKFIASTFEKNDRILG